MVAEELASMIDEDELARIEGMRSPIAVRGWASRRLSSQEELLAELTHPDWERRLKAIQKIEVNNETFFAVVAALDHERSAIRRWAAAILGGSGMPEAIEPLCKVVLPTQARSCVEPQVTPSAILGCTGERDDVPSGGSLEAAVESRPVPQ